MSERWRFQIISGILWAVMTLVITMLIDMEEQPIGPQLTSSRFYIKLVIQLFFGIFFMGYLFWKGQDEKNNKWSTFFGKKKK